MKIGLYSPYLDTMGGGEKYMLTAALCLAKTHQVTVFWDKADIAHLAKNKFAMDLTPLTFTKNIFTPDVSFFKRFAASSHYDRIIVLSDGSMPLVNTKLILHFQTPVEWVKGSSFKTVLKKQKVAGIICNSHYTKMYIDKKFGVKSNVIYPPVIIPRISEQKKENYILNVGRFGVTNAGSSFKKQDVMLAAFKELVDEGLRNWRFILVISTANKDHEKELAVLEETYKNLPVAFIKNPTNDVLWENYAKSKIYWHAAGFGEDLALYPDRAEHFGIATVEAMGAGCVPVVINAGGQKEIVGDTQNGFLWGTISELKTATLSLVTDHNKWEVLASNAKKRAADFNEGLFCSSWNDTIIRV